MKIHEGEVCYIAFLREDHEAVSGARWSAEDEASPDVLGRELVMKVCPVSRICCGPNQHMLSDHRVESSVQLCDRSSRVLLGNGRALSGKQSVAQRQPVD